MLQQPLRGEIIKVFVKEGEPYIGGLNILWGTLVLKELCISKLLPLLNENLLLKLE